MISLAWEVMLYGLGGVFAALLILFITVSILVKIFQIISLRKKKQQDTEITN